MRVIAKPTINQFIEKYPKAEEAILRWYLLTKEADWANFSEMKQSFPGTDSVGNDLYVFNIGGNKFRLIARIFFKSHLVYIRFLDTHKAYDKVNLSNL